MKNTKKLPLLTLALAAMLGLVSCGGNSSSDTSSSYSQTSSTLVGDITRSQAVEVLGKIVDHTSASSFSAPKSGMITNSTKIVSVNTTTGFFNFTSTFKSDYADKAGTVLITSGTLLGAYTTSEGEFHVYQIKNAFASSAVKAVTVYKDDASGTLKALVDTAMTTYLKKATYASAFATYLNNFNDDGSANTGGTASGAVYVKSGTYSTTGAGNLTVDINVRYSKATSDEHIIYKWDNYLCISQKSQSETTFDWETSSSLQGIDETDATIGTLDEGKNIISYM